MFMQCLVHFFYCALDTPVAQVSIPGADLDKVSQLLLYGSSFFFDISGDLWQELRIVVMYVP